MFERVKHGLEWLKLDEFLVKGVTKDHDMIREYYWLAHQSKKRAVELLSELRTTFFIDQSWLQVSNNTGILNTCTRLWQTESKQATLVDSIKDVVRSSVEVPEFDKHRKKAGEHIDRTAVEIKTKMKTIVRKPLMIKIIKLRFRNSPI